MTTPLTLQIVRDLGHQVVNERGSKFRYRDAEKDRLICLYVKASDPRAPRIERGPRFPLGAFVTGCVVGEILTRAGLMTDKIAGCTTSISQLITWGDVPVDPSERALVRQYLHVLQTEQDGGATWGEALVTAERSIKLR